MYASPRNRGQQTFSVKDWVVSTVGFAGRMVSDNYSALLVWCKGSHRQCVNENE